MQLTHARRNSLITGVTTIAVASVATLALALPQETGTAEAATPVGTTSADGRPVAPTAAADQAQAEAEAQAQAQADADADAAAAAAAAAQAQADADAQAQAQAQADAKAKADAAAAASRAQQRPALNSTGALTGTPQQIAAQIVPAGQLQCFKNIVQRESTWKVTATNPSSGAYGLVQALPGSKMASAGADWRTNPATQLKWGLNYMNSRYGSPCGAWAFWQAHHWY